jgi:hypothetical protein
MLYSSTSRLRPQGTFQASHSAQVLIPKRDKIMDIMKEICEKSMDDLDCKFYDLDNMKALKKEEKAEVDSVGMT